MIVKSITDCLIVHQVLLRAPNQRKTVVTLLRRLTMLHVVVLVVDVASQCIQQEFYGIPIYHLEEKSSGKNHRWVVRTIIKPKFPKGYYRFCNLFNFFFFKRNSQVASSNVCSIHCHTTINIHIINRRHESVRKSKSRKDDTQRRYYPSEGISRDAHKKRKLSTDENRQRTKNRQNKCDEK